MRAPSPIYPRYLQARASEASFRIGRDGTAGPTSTDALISDTLPTVFRRDIGQLHTMSLPRTLDVTVGTLP